MVQRQLEEQSGYDTLGVGKVSQISSPHSPDLVPVFVAFTELKGVDLLSLGQVALWPRTRLAVYGEKSVDSSTPPGSFTLNMSPILKDEKTILISMLLQ